MYDLESALTSLGIGEAIVTVLSEKGAPTPVAWTRMRAPRSLMDTIGPDAIAAAAKASPLQAEYGQTIDRDSAYERLNARLRRLSGPRRRRRATAAAARRHRRSQRRGRGEDADAVEPGMFDKMMASPAFKSAMRSAGTVIGREITRSIFGTGRRRALRLSPKRNSACEARVSTTRNFRFGHTRIARQQRVLARRRASCRPRRRSG